MPDGSAATILVGGEIDLATSDRIVSAASQGLHDSSCGSIILDLGAVTFIDCSGLSALLMITKSCDERGCEFVIRNPSRCVTRLLALTGLDRELQLYLDAC